ncbi:GNAT family N-acetyltransferase [Candidatus Chloroploca sp. M-50]|uniref:GNAT family N-acetyltransferase n=1 Tax=Candidatus Chloroploca mongolica TaxID=2528176 RepID=A0ABS4DAG6_9CHLR|nr:GNAT family N-acetyltransferase [Candidatus Chloroploca mongolica]MBP1466444.1 GNAT family N-acetyltransferase [Candidatus Chloroploca mongolica]
MKLTLRKYQSDHDYWNIRALLRELFLANDHREISWPLYRWDYWRWHVNENILKFDLSAAIFIWETAEGRLAAVLHPDGAGEAFLQVHPTCRCPELEVAMLSVAETQFATTQADGRQRLVVWAHENDQLRQDVLKRRGYARGNHPEYQRRREMSLPIPDVPTPAGYTLRALGDLDELRARSWLSWKVFHPHEPDEKYEGWAWYTNIQRAPLYRRDLDLVAVAPNGAFAAFCTLWYDEATRTAAFEPVGTHPEHQRTGLGKALMAEGLRRVRDLGATLCTVGSYTDAAGALYASLGFIEYDVSEPWVKAW